MEHYTIFLKMKTINFRKFRFSEVKSPGFGCKSPNLGY